MTHVFTVLYVTNVSVLTICIRWVTACGTVMEIGIYQVTSKVESYIVILQFFSHGRDEIFSCGFRHNMRPTSC